jgi:hypothetical protein
MHWSFNEAIRDARRDDSFYPEEFSLQLTPEISDRVLTAVTTGALPGDLLPILLHEYTHSNLTASPLGNLITDTRNDIGFAKHQYCFSPFGERFADLAARGQIADALSRYVTFWQEGIATFVELNSRCDRLPDEYWADSATGFRAALSQLSARPWTDSDYETCRREQVLRLTRVLTMPCSGGIEGSYLIGYLVVWGIYEKLKEKLPELSVDIFVDLLSSVLFFDPTIWLRSADVLARSVIGELADPVDELRRCFESGCEGVIAVLKDINSMSRRECADLLASLESRSYKVEESYEDYVFARVDLPMLTRWSERSRRVTGRELAEASDRLEDDFQVWRTSVDHLEFHDEKFSHFEFFGPEPNREIVTIDSHATLAFSDGDEVVVHLELLSHIHGNEPSFRIPKSALIFARNLPALNLGEGEFNLFYVRRSGSLGATIIGDDYASIHWIRGDNSADATRRIYREFLRRFYLRRTYIGTTESAQSPAIRAREFDARLRDAERLELGATRTWTATLAKLAGTFPRANIGPATIPSLMSSPSFCPTIDLWFGGIDSGRGYEKCIQFAQAYIDHLYDS